METNVEGGVVSTLNAETNGAPKGLISLDSLRDLAKKRPEVRRVTLPPAYKDLEWYVRKGRVSEREKWEKDNTVRDKRGRESLSRENVRADLLWRATVHPDGKQFFDGSKKEAYELINDLPADLVEAVFDDVIEYWGIKRSDAEEVQNGGNS